MKKQKTNGWQCLRALTLLTVGAMTLMAFAHPSVNNLRQSVVEVRTDTLDREKAYDVVDEMPQFPGGISAMMSWIGGNLTYPQSCIEQRIEGRVIVSFVVDKSGAVRDAAIVKSVAPELDEAALNVVMAMPRWIPGRKGGEAVNVKYTIPLNFKLPEPDTDNAAE